MDKTTDYGKAELGVAIERQAGEITKLLDELSMELNMLDDHTDNLQGRLQPILRNEPSPETDKAQRSLTTDLGQYMQMLIERSRNTNRKLSDINSKLEL